MTDCRPLSGLKTSLCLAVAVSFGWAAWPRDEVVAQHPTLVRVSLKDSRHCLGESPELETSCDHGHCKGSYHPSITASGRLVAFTSDSGHVSCATPTEAGLQQVWVRDIEAGRTLLVSANAVTGRAGDKESDFARIASDGSCIAFGSLAELVPGDHEHRDVYLNTLSEAGHPAIVERISEAPDGTSGNGDSARPDLSADGRWIVFQTKATNLTPPEALQTTGQVFQVALVDRMAVPEQRARWISISSPQLGPPRLAHYACTAPRISESTPPRVVWYSSDGGLTPADSNATEDVFVRDVAAGVTRAVSITPHGHTANGWSRRPAISANGRWVAFESAASNLTAEPDTNDASDIYVRDLQLGRTVRVSVLIDATGAAIEASGGHAIGPEISADGRIVVFTSGAPDMFPGASRTNFKLCAHDRDADGDGIYDETGPGERRTWCLAPPSGTQADQWTGGTPIDLASNAKFVVFMSEASTLVHGDHNGAPELNPGSCCRRRKWSSAIESGPEACTGVLTVPPCEWGRDVFRLAIELSAPHS